MTNVVVGVVGFVVGAALCALWALTRQQRLQREGERWRVQATALEEQRVRDDEERRKLDAAHVAQLDELRDRVAQAAQDRRDLEENHRVAMASLRDTFRGLSAEVLNETAERLRAEQESAHKVRAESIDQRLEPLTAVLKRYQEDLAKFDEAHREALSDVRVRASQLLDAQQKSLAETARLNTLLGRASQRGRWGEVQLANVLEASNLRHGIDYTLQFTSRNEDGRGVRPDCVVNLGNGAHVAVDAKFPFDAYEAALDADGEERRTLLAKHAKDLRGHVKSLADKSYWEAVTPSPEFVVCFVPSDAAVAAAFESDPELLRYASDQKVVIAGPSNLMGILWSVALVIREVALHENIDEIKRISAELYDRVRYVATPILEMGRALDKASSQYNKLVGSIESQLITSAKRVQRLSGTTASAAKTIPDLARLDQSTRALNPAKWGPLADLPAAASEVLEFEDLDEDVVIEALGDGDVDHDEEFEAE